MTNTKDVFQFALNLMQKLDKGEIDVENAKAQANLIKQSNNVLKYELDKSIAQAKFGDAFKIKELG